MKLITVKLAILAALSSCNSSPMHHKPHFNNQYFGFNGAHIGAGAVSVGLLYAHARGVQKEYLGLGALAGVGALGLSKTVHNQKTLLQAAGAGLIVTAFERLYRGVFTHGKTKKFQGSQEELEIQSIKAEITEFKRARNQYLMQSLACGVAGAASIYASSRV